MLLEAFQIHEDEVSKSSGLPYWITRSIDPDIMLAVQEREDRADALLAEWDEKNAGNKKKKGVSRFVVPVDAEGKPLEYGGLTRQQFREQAASFEDDTREDRVSTDRDDDGHKYAVIPED